MDQGHNDRWVTAAALAALAKHAPKAGARFTNAELRAWLPKLSTAQRTNASSRLCKLGFITHHMEVIEGQRADVYTVTDAGRVAIASAAKGEVRKSGPKGTRRANPVKPDALVTRLWNLVRIRKIVDSESCALTLCDAGDQDFATVQANVRRYLRRWANANVLTEGAKRNPGDGNSNGTKRYVLLADPGPTPPQWRKAEEARA